MSHLSLHSFFRTLCCAFIICMGSDGLFANGNEEIPFPEVMPIVHEKNQSEAFIEMSVLKDAIQNFNNDNYYLQRIHADGYYHLLAFSDMGDVIQMHDASKWQIERSGRQKVLYWVQNDEIFIKPCISWFSFNKYVLHNRTINQTVEATLIHPPLPMGIDTFRIVNIQPYDRLVLLSDNTVWQVDTDSHFPKWRIGQRLIVGVNNYWRTATHPHILINVDISGEPYSPATFYGYPVQ